MSANRPVHPTHMRWLKYCIRGQVRCHEFAARQRYVEDVVAPPTNLKKAEQHKAAIEHAISIGAFDYSVTFPGSPRAAKFAPEVNRETKDHRLIRWAAGLHPHLGLAARFTVRLFQHLHARFVAVDERLSSSRSRIKFSSGWKCSPHWITQRAKVWRGISIPWRPSTFSKRCSGRP